MPTTISLYFSFACPGSYRAHTWLREVGRDLVVDWRPYAIRTEGQVDYWGRAWYAADSELRGFIAAEAACRQGTAPGAAFRSELFDAVQGRGQDLGDEATLVQAATQAGLDVARFQADWQDRSLIELIRDGQRRAVENPGVLGTPTLVFVNGRVLHMELTNAPTGVEAQRLLEIVTDLAKATSFAPALRPLTGAA